MKNTLRFLLLLCYIAALHEKTFAQTNKCNMSIENMLKIAREGRQTLYAVIPGCFEPIRDEDKFVQYASFYGDYTDYIGIDDFKPKKKTDSKCRFVFSTSSADTYNRYKNALLKLGFAYAGKGEDKSDVYGFNNYILSTS